MAHSGTCVCGRKSSQPVVGLVLMLTLTMFDGVIESCIGPSLHDLQCIYSVSAQTISLLFPVYAGFKTAGCLLYSPLLIFLGNTTLIPLCVLISSCMVAVIPLCPLFHLAVAASSVLGLTEGIVNTGRVSIIGSYAQDSAVPFHLLGLAMSIGDILGPLIVSPFLASNSHHGNSPNTSVDADQTQVECHESQPGIYYAYLIIAALGILLTCGLIIIYSREYKNTENVKTQVNEKKLNLGKYEIILVSGLILLLVTGGATGFVYGTLLSPFGTHCSLRIHGTIMALMTSSFYLVTLLGRVSGVFLSLIMSQLSLLITCFIGVLASSVFLLFTAEVSTVFLWSGSHVFGLFYAPVFSSVVAWGFENLPGRDNVYSIVVFSDLVGTSLVALIVGELMASHGPQMLHVCMVETSLLQIVIFVVLICFGNQVKDCARGDDYKTIRIT